MVIFVDVLDQWQIKKDTSSRSNVRGSLSKSGTTW